MKIVAIPRRFVKHEWGGTETVILETAKGLGELGHDVSIHTSLALSQDHQERIDGIAVTRYKYFYPNLGLSPESRELLDKKGGNLFSTHLLSALLKLKEVDVIHLHTGKRVGGIARVVARRRKIPYVITVHGGVFELPPEEHETFTKPTRGTWEWGKILGWLVGSRRVLDDAAAIICVNPEEARVMTERYPHSLVRHLPNGVDVERFKEGDGAGFREHHAIPTEAKVILCLSRIDPQKNQLQLVRTLPRILARVPQAHLLLIGPVTNGPYGELIRSEIKQLNIHSRTTLITGLQNQASSLVDAYHACDLFALPSIHEPFGIVILEAWAARRPVVASRIGGIPHFVEEEKNGLLFEPGNDDQLVQGACHLLLNPQLADSLVQGGWQAASQRYGWRAIAKSLEGLYEEVTATFHRSG